MVIETSDTTAIKIDIDEREYKLLKMCEEYSKDAFGMPNHNLMILVAKLWKWIKENV